MTISPGGCPGEWDRSIWEERTPSGLLWRVLSPASSCCSGRPSTIGAVAAAVKGSSFTGTVLEHCRTPLSVRASFIRLMCHNVPAEFAVEPCGATHKTTFEWRYRVLATVFGFQDRIVLRDTVWVYDLVLPTRMLILKS